MYCSSGRVLLLVLEPAERAFCREDGTETDSDRRNDALVPARVVPVGVSVVCGDGDEDRVRCEEQDKQAVSGLISAVPSAG